MNEIAQIFTYTDADVSLTVEAEVDLIVAAQAGDADAYVRLLTAYGRTLRAVVNAAKKTVDEEEAQAVALVAFAEILSSHDPFDEAYQDGRLASRLTPHLRDALGSLQAQENLTFTVPKRTYTRYLGILNEAEGDVEAARDLAPDRGMRVSTFDEIHAIVRKTSSAPLADDEDAEPQEGTPVLITAPSSFDEAEDRILIDVAFSAVDDEGARIVELAYGFTEYDPVPDAEIGHRLGLTRPTVQRKRGKALDSMRKALGVTPEA